MLIANLADPATRVSVLNRGATDPAAAPGPVLIPPAVPTAPWPLPRS